MSEQAPFQPNAVVTTPSLSVSKDEFLARCGDAFDKGWTVTIVSGVDHQ